MVSLIFSDGDASVVARLINNSWIPMFEWLQEELLRIKTRKFHIVDGPASAKLKNAVEANEFPLPPSYRAFVLQFGNAKLYRIRSYWLVEVFAGPREAEGPEGEPLILFGRTDTSLAYFKEHLLVRGEESPVFEWRHEQGIQRTADSFVDWLFAKCISARKRFRRSEWAAIEKGPPPFTNREMAIVTARRQFRWRVVGVSLNDDLRFEIYNGSTLVLPYLSIGVRGRLRAPKEGPLEGGAFLPVALIRPGERQVVEFDCYKQLVAPEDVEVFDLPDPGPEDREQYWEFKSHP
jgi:hypothetical protein